MLGVPRPASTPVNIMFYFKLLFKEVQTCSLAAFLGLTFFLVVGEFDIVVLSVVSRLWNHERGAEGDMSSLQQELLL